jgi:hypothetical protein
MEFHDPRSESRSICATMVGSHVTADGASRARQPPAALLACVSLGGVLLGGVLLGGVLLGGVEAGGIELGCAPCARARVARERPVRGDVELAPDP